MCKANGTITTKLSGYKHNFLSRPAKLSALLQTTQHQETTCPPIYIVSFNLSVKQISGVFCSLCVAAS